MFLYKANETMRMLGHQSPVSLLAKGGIADEDYGNLIDAHIQKGTESLREFGYDAFMLGYIYGIRAERNKRKRKRQSAIA